MAADPGVSDMSHETTSSTLDLRAAPLPTARTLRMRQNVFYQAYRFAALGVRILRMVLKRHR